ncbi:hypothetical protein ACFQX6_65965 [Streptosporangium lutulentum]
MAAAQEEPIWQPLSMLAVLSVHVKEGGTAAREHRAALEKGRFAPRVLDDATVARVKKVFTQTAEDNALFAEQGALGGGRPHPGPAQPGRALRRPGRRATARDHRDPRPGRRARHDHHRDGAGHERSGARRRGPAARRHTVVLPPPDGHGQLEAVPETGCSRDRPDVR